VTRHAPLLRRALILVVVGTIGIGSAACQPKRAASAPKPAQNAAPIASSAGSESAQLLSLVNRFRAANGLPALAQAGDATAKAQQHANEMAASRSLVHSASLPSGIQSGWTALGENVGVGGSASQLEAMFEGSGAHRKNMLSGAYSQIGVGVARGGDGQIYATEFFVGR
jgi:uncharacterized protein YkwD